MSVPPVAYVDDDAAFKAKLAMIARRTPKPMAEKPGAEKPGPVALRRRRYVADCEQRIARQEIVVTRLLMAGLDTAKAEAFLDDLYNILRAYRKIDAYLLGLNS
jgi:hypothetical protein